jgi:hypothetical protein
VPGWTAAEGPRQTVGAAGVHVWGSCHVNSTREHIHADTHTHTQGRDAGAGRESSGVAKGARTLSGSGAKDCEHDRGGGGGVDLGCCHRCLEVVGMREWIWSEQRAGAAYASLGVLAARVRVGRESFRRLA